jgi:hypothetical protein
MNDFGVVLANFLIGRAKVRFKKKNMIARKIIVLFAIMNIKGDR